MRRACWTAALCMGLAQPALAEDAPPPPPPPAQDAAGAESPQAPAPAPRPDPLEAMVRAAIAKGNDAEMDAVIKFAGETAPERADAFRAMADARRQARAAEKEAKLRDASIFALWDGQIELGGFSTTGNTDTTGLSGGLNLRRDGLKWRHKLAASADYQESSGVASRERYTGSYEANYKFDERAYIVGIVQYENDRFLGYDSRYSASTGLGYRALRGKKMTLDLEAGPAMRYTRYTGGGSERAVAGRGSIDFTWKLSPAVRFDQDLSLYADKINSSVVSTTALNAKLFGPLSARFTYHMQFEGDPIDERKQLDTLSRASLVYSF